MNILDDFTICHLKHNSLDKYNLNGLQSNNCFYSNKLNYVIGSSCLFKNKRSNYNIYNTFVKNDGHSIYAHSDYWGIYPLYYFNNDDIFILSNNIYSIKHLLNNRHYLKADKNSFFDYLFFNFPLKNKTWFEDIKCLESNNELKYCIDNKYPIINKLNIDSNINIILNDNIMEAITNYFETLFDLRNEIGLSISAGSDSRTLLSCLRYFDIKHRLFCFGRDNYAEYLDIKKFLKELGETLEYIKLSDNTDEYEYILEHAIVQSNGLINPFRVHYYDYYNKLPDNIYLMEGLLGSEFVKGEISCPTMTSYPVKELLFYKYNISNIVKNRFYFLSPDERINMTDYLLNEYNPYIQCINDQDITHLYAKYLFNTLPAKVFGGLIQIAARKLYPIYPFLDMGILSSIFKNGYGILHYSSFSNNFPGPIKCLIPEALIVKKTDRKIYNQILDRKISFSDAFNILAPMKKKLRCIPLNIFPNRHLFYGQIDNKPTKEKIREIIINDHFYNYHINDDNNIILWYYNKVLSVLLQ